MTQRRAPTAGDKTLCELVKDRELKQRDPYPELPVMPREALEEGDVLMMLGYGCAEVSGYWLPISYMIRMLDGGAYSHATLVSRKDGELMAWDHRAKGMTLAPGPLEEALAGHLWCHVYRFEKDGQHLGSPRFPRAALLEALNEHRGDGYGIPLLLMAAVAALLCRGIEDPDLKERLRLMLIVLIELLEAAQGRPDFDRTMQVCTAVPGLSHWEAFYQTPNDYALDIDLERIRQVPLRMDDEWRSLMARLQGALKPHWPDIEQDLEHRRGLVASNAHWVPAGSLELPANLIGPADLEHSRNLQRVGKLQLPRP